MDDERLMEEVRKFSPLWDVSTNAYRESKAKENAWKVVAKEVNVLVICTHIIPWFQCRTNLKKVYLCWRCDC